MSLLGLDIGTSACKAATFDEEGHLLAVATAEYAGASPKPGWMEMHPDVMWDAVVETVRRVASETPDTIRALSISSHGETFIPVDSNGRAIGPAIMNADNRAVEEVKVFEDVLGREGIYKISGCVLHPMYALLKILWLQKNQSDVYNKAAKFLTVGDCALLRLGLKPVVDYSLASRIMAFDVNKRQWSKELLDIAGIEEDRFAEVRQAGTPAGELSKSVADELGLRPGTIVAVGGHDQPCGALGAGVVKPGDTADSAGSYECLAVASEKPVLTVESLAYNLNSYCHVVPDRYITLAFFPAGIVLRWFRDQFAQAEVAEAKSSGKNAYDLLSSKLTDHPTGICFAPHFIGSGNPTWNVMATGALVGLRPGTSRHQLFGAILEGIACEIKANATVLEKMVGQLGVLRTFGGGAKSDYWLQLRADITGREVVSMRTSEAVCLGAALLAGVAAGVYTDATDAASKVARFNKSFEPDSARAAEYAEQIALYEKLYPALAGAGIY